MDALMALAAAALFGATAPVAKALLAGVSPLVLAGLFYVGAGLGASLFAWRTNAPLQRADTPWLAGIVVAGGVVGPSLLFYGLKRSSASATSLLLNLEAVFTTLLALAFFRERLGLRGFLALLLLVAGAALLTFERGGASYTLLGPLAIAGACLAWGFDNNFTRRLADRDPLVVVAYKGLLAGSLSLALGLTFGGGNLPPLRTLALALLVGALGYGLSLVLYVRALRTLGAARTGLLFATAPFTGALLSIPLLHELPTPALALAGALMASGVLLLLRDQTHPQGQDPRS
jgi:drug/metabolite transporter (DMT)-like permease